MEETIPNSSAMKVDYDEDNGKDKSAAEDEMSYSEKEIRRLNIELAKANDHATQLSKDMGTMSINVDWLKIKISKLEKTLSQKEEECEKLKIEVAESSKLREATEENHKLALEDKLECEKMLKCFMECVQDENLYYNFDSNYRAEDFSNKNPTKFVDKLYTAMKFVLQRFIDLKSKQSSEQELYKKLFIFFKQSFTNAQNVVEDLKKFGDLFSSSSSSRFADVTQIHDKDNGIFNDNDFPTLLQANVQDKSASGKRKETMKDEGTGNDGGAGMEKNENDNNVLPNSDEANVETVTEAEQTETASSTETGAVEKLRKSGSEDDDTNSTLVSEECSPIKRSKRKCTMKTLPPPKKIRTSDNFEGEHNQIGETAVCTCSRKFSHVQALKNHISFWRRPKTFKCRGCEMMFPYAKTLNDHMKVTGHDGNAENKEKVAVLEDVHILEEKANVAEGGSHKEMEGQSEGTLGGDILGGKELDRNISDFSCDEQLDKMGPGLLGAEGIESDLKGNERGGEESKD